MAIAFNKYIDITSSVGGGAAVRERELIARVVTTNPLLPPNTYLEFRTLADVGSYFNTTSEEYLRASDYFGWVSKVSKRATKISFARWADQSSAPRIYGAPGTQALGSWTSITSGAFNITIGGETLAVTAVNFSTALSLSDVASLIEDKLQASAEPQFTNASVTWDPVRQSFNLVGTFAGNEEISVTPGAGTDIAGQLGWLLEDNAIWSNGAVAQTLTTFLDETTEMSDNFGTLVFIPDLDLDDYVEIASWNTAQNVKYMVMVPVSAANAAAWSAALVPTYWGMALTFSPVSTQYPEMFPMSILAATDYTQRNASANYMFQRDFPGLTASVTTTTVSNQYDSLRVNYYGNTQTAGQVLNFYQRGTLTGGASAPVDQNVYANEMWLKGAAGAALMSLLLSLNRVSANKQGRSEVLTTLQSVIDRALFNGVISVGKPFNNTQILYVTQVTGDQLAWRQVQDIGYWVDAVIQSYVTIDGRTEYKIVYTLIYSKDDAVRKIEGSHILI